MPISLSDAECLRRFVACGDERAFALVVERHLGLVHGAALRVLGDADAAQEVAQCVFILLAKQSWRLTTHPAVAGWLYRSADREALVLRYFSGKSVREVGEALGIREDAAQKRLSKALDALTRCFRRRGMR